jgi:tetratricopeptide (TPR) repeat protein
MNQRTILKAALMLACAAGLLLARQAPPSQPQSTSPIAKQPVLKFKEEADGVMAVFSAQDPDSRIKAGEAVLKAFPGSEFKSMVLYLIAASYQQKDDEENTLAYAGRVLEVDPEHYQAMVMIARNIALRTKEFDLDREEKLATVEKDGKRALELLKTAPRPNPNVTDQQWDEAKKEFTSQVYEAFGMAAMARNKPDQAIEQFKKALETSPSPDSTTMVRLGAAYSKAGKYDDAIALLDKVIALKDLSPAVQQIAQAERTRAQQSKSKDAAPPQPAPVKP